MLEKEVKVMAKDNMGFGSYANTHILRVKNEDEMAVADALDNAGVRVIHYSNAGMAYAEDVAEKLLTTMVKRRAIEQEVNDAPMPFTDRVLADEAIYNARVNVGEIVYDKLMDREAKFAMSVTDDIIEHAHKNLSVEESMKLGLLTPTTLVNKLVDESESDNEIEDLLEDELDKHYEFGSAPHRHEIMSSGVRSDRGCISKKSILY